LAERVSGGVRPSAWCGRHLRRFCLIALGERVPHESTVRKLTRRLGGAAVDELMRCVIAKAQRETRFKPLEGGDSTACTGRRVGNSAHDLSHSRHRFA
jgi:hypothetical protein